MALKEYKKDEFDYAKMEAAVRGNHTAEILSYLENDCRFLYELVEGFRNLYGSPLTLASAGMQFFKGLGNEIPKTTRHFYEKFSPFYHGGRVTCFKAGVFDNVSLRYIDLNSAYPFAMSHSHPWGDTWEEWEVLPPVDGLGPCFLELEAASTGVFGCEWEKGMRGKPGDYCFPVDNVIRRFYVTGWEFLAARDTGFLRNFRFIRGFSFSQHINFSEYVDHFFEQKKNAAKGSPERLYAKLFLNSLYGKMSADPSRYKNFKIIPQTALEYDGKSKNWYYLDENERLWLLENLLGSKKQLALISQKLPEYQQRYYNVATGASITGFVRALLWRGICEVKNPYYCDTDSIMAENTGKLPLNENLGGWKLEANIDRIAIAGKKLYAAHTLDPKEPWRLAHKGADLTAAEIFDIAAGKTIEYQREAPSMSLKTGIKFISRKIKKTV